MASNERMHLEIAHHELCTALTVVRTNLALAASRVTEGAADEAEGEVRLQIEQADLGVDRLVALARAMREWCDSLE